MHDCTVTYNKTANINDKNSIKISVNYGVKFLI